uniref:Uncharacterized protein n=1 Tax=Utricularia reniformis TaxID=192314 RepID=A0A1Y0B434_9LAMI|nr:hypothetical protein AEK19_MT1997 [Utricularia reniformis]ART32160.1 hypothetical protein AEK19_MT1997 [Utricularia reniformis]
MPSSSSVAPFVHLFITGLSRKGRQNSLRTVFNNRGCKTAKTTYYSYISIQTLHS